MPHIRYPIHQFRWLGSVLAPIPLFSHRTQLYDSASIYHNFFLHLSFFAYTQLGFFSRSFLMTS
jgi:hypothetical protein